MLNALNFQLQALQTQPHLPLHRLALVSPRPLPAPLGPPLCLQGSRYGSGDSLSLIVGPISAILALARHQRGTTVHVLTLSSLRKSSRCDCHWEIGVCISEVTTITVNASESPWMVGLRGVSHATGTASMHASFQGPG
jgi:hypothetical protein